MCRMIEKGISENPCAQHRILVRDNGPGMRMVRRLWCAPCLNDKIDELERIVKEQANGR